VRRDQLKHDSTLAAKLDLAERILDYSNRNIELTMEILVGSPQDIKPHLVELSENGAAISSLIERLRSEVEGDKEGDFWPRQARHGPALTVTQNHCNRPLMAKDASTR
jgi:hypothetical protein